MHEQRKTISGTKSTCIFRKKSQRLGDTLGVQVFKVDSTATKREIKQAVELMFEGVEVVKVNTLNTKGKTKRFGRVVGKRSDVKKSVCNLKSWFRRTNRCW